MAATRSDWQTTPLSTTRESITLDRAYSNSEVERIKEGHVPVDMDDRWFAFYEEPWLYVHRSWTGYCVFQVRFEPDADGARPVEILINRDTNQHRGKDGASDVLLIAALLDGYAGRDAHLLWGQYMASFE